MGQQIQSVQVFADSGPNADVNAARLNGHVNDAVLMNGAVIVQPPAPAPKSTHVIMVGDTSNAPTAGLEHLALNNLLLPEQRDGTQRWGGTAGGTVNALTLATSPASSGPYLAGEVIRFKTAGANTGAVSINLDGRGNANLFSAAPAALSAGALPAGAVVEAVFDGVQFQCVSVFVSAGSITSAMATEGLRGSTQQYVLATGTANAIAVAPLNSSGGATYSALIVGMTVKFKAAFTNTASATVTVNGLTATPIFSPLGVALTGGEILIGSITQLVYDGTNFVMAGNYPARFTGTAAATLSQTNQVFAHGLGRVPTKVRAVFLCTTNQAPWVVNDEVDAANVINNGGSSFPTLNWWANGTNVVTSLADLTKLNACSGSGAYVLLTPGSWKIKVYAEV